MKKLITIVVFTLLSFGAYAQNLIGAWENYYTSESGEKLKRVAIFSEGYNVVTTYNADTGEFIHSKGGSWKLEGRILIETIEFDTKNSESIGQEFSTTITISKTVFNHINDEIQFNRIDNGEPGKLQGAWLMSGRVINGKSQLRDTSGPRKTMKIMSGTRFQWIAYNTETKKFMGTGGGTYTTKNGKYTENIEFFSRDNSRVGASLEFDYNLDNGDWHHSGFSSKGDPLHEVWRLRE
ncbi:hypothetical protein DFQ11_10538 [Winogradskyella epiphytica]|uniref:Membrane or secreted protein n=1 Tax=Winogradskyella epiphytica TaxID=262005 RepID=A0A2V4XRD8_9FLAO|nr:membrane or secreted protein [Winogradskyella epiphytica]PYE80441.1 hypothetical protein DFQ11_10538 [Winogradskyella epiphytica]GGW69442.1 hypothetical protein GCM10008085_21750 [Winogradskyella epiphytica]